MARRPTLSVRAELGNPLFRRTLIIGPLTPPTPTFRSGKVVADQPLPNCLTPPLETIECQVQKAAQSPMSDTTSTSKRSRHTTVEDKGPDSDSDREHDEAGDDANKANKRDEWAAITDPVERRRVQNRIAQRKFREKTKQRHEDASRRVETEQTASSSYAAPQRATIDERNSLAGAPWGTLSLGFMVEKGNTANVQSDQQNLSFRPAPLPAARHSSGLKLVPHSLRVGSPEWRQWIFEADQRSQGHNDSSRGSKRGADSSEKEEVPLKRRSTR